MLPFAAGSVTNSYSYREHGAHTTHATQLSTHGAHTTHTTHATPGAQMPFRYSSTGIAQRRPTMPQYLRERAAGDERSGTRREVSGAPRAQPVPMVLLPPGPSVPFQFLQRHGLLPQQADHSTTSGRSKSATLPVTLPGPPGALKHPQYWPMASNFAAHHHTGTPPPDTHRRPGAYHPRVQQHPQQQQHPRQHQHHRHHQPRIGCSEQICVGPCCQPRTVYVAPVAHYKHKHRGPIARAKVEPTKCAWGSEQVPKSNKCSGGKARASENNPPAPRPTEPGKHYYPPVVRFVFRNDAERAALKAPNANIDSAAQVAAAESLVALSRLRVCDDSDAAEWTSPQARLDRSPRNKYTAGYPQQPGSVSGSTPGSGGQTQRSRTAAPNNAFLQHTLNFHMPNTSTAAKLHPSRKRKKGTTASPPVAAATLSRQRTNTNTAATTTATAAATTTTTTTRTKRQRKPSARQFARDVTPPPPPPISDYETPRPSTPVPIKTAGSITRVSGGRHRTAKVAKVPTFLPGKPQCDICFKVRSCRVAAVCPLFFLLCTIIVRVRLRVLLCIVVCAVMFVCLALASVSAW